MIGSLGLVWIALWFLTVPRAMLVAAHPTANNQGTERAARFREVFRDVRFWALLAVVIGIDLTWHGYRTWLPLYLQEQRGYTLEQMSKFTTVYYIMADVGSWTVGLLTLLFCRRGMRVHTSRLLAFGGSSGLTMMTVAVPFLPSGLWLEAALLAVAFGALGLFPTYFSLSQELSARHQGKVTGTLGASAHLSLAVLYPIEGWVCDVTHSYEWVLGTIGLFPILGFGILIVLWPSDRNQPITENQTPQ